MSSPLVSVCIPYIRPEKFQRCVNALKGDKSFQDFEIVAEEDTERIGCPRMLKKLVDKSKGDMICFLGDDTIPYLGLLRYAIETMKKFEGGWGLVGFNDGFVSGPNHATHWLGHKKLLSFLDGEFFHTGYSHCFSDNELFERVNEIERYKFDQRARLVHDHPIIKKQPTNDQDYIRVYSQKYMDHDQKLFLQRRTNGWR